MHQRLQWCVGPILRPLFCLILCTSLVRALASKPPREEDTAPSPLTLDLSALLAVPASAGEAGKTGHAFPAVTKILDSPSTGAKLTAFEENRLFVYGAGKIQTGPAGKPWTRRIIYLKPSTFLIDDEMLAAEKSLPPRWRLSFSSRAAELRDGKLRVRVDGQTILCETLYPAQTQSHISPASPTQEGFLEETGQSTRRFLHLISLDAANLQGYAPLKVLKDRLELHIARHGVRYRLTLPPATVGAGEISVASATGKTLVATRPLPSGILPHTSEGIQLLEVWDADYRDGLHPRWDTGRPAADLKKVVEDGTVRPGRAVEFGCGTGTDAIYLASRGFDVTAIDISPSALAQAIAKARQAGVKVRWMLADALNPPEIGKFDFIYDRACYHEVRIQNLKAYIEALRKSSHPGTRMLLLAGNANGPDLGFGPPTVTEEELRYDFLPLFDFEWLRTSHFEINRPGAGLPLAWCALLRRKAE